MAAKKLRAAVEMGRRGGKKRVAKGFAKMKPSKRTAIHKKAAAARLEKITPEQRSEIARNAARKRWGKKPKRWGKKPKKS